MSAQHDNIHELADEYVLGLLEAARSVVLEGPDLPQPREDQLYEITVENEGGSPTGRPTGPILVKGFAKLPR